MHRIGGAADLVPALLSTHAQREATARAMVALPLGLVAVRAVGIWGLPPSARAGWPRTRGVLTRLRAPALHSAASAGAPVLHADHGFRH